MCQEFTKNLIVPDQRHEDGLDNAVEDNEIPDFESQLTSIHPRTFESYTVASVHIAMNVGVSLGRKLLREGAKVILDEVKAASSKSSGSS
jgi:hypothetical protein